MSQTDDYILTAQFLPLVEGKLSRSQVLEMAQRGQLDAIQPAGPNGRYFIRRSEAERLLRPVWSKK